MDRSIVEQRLKSLRGQLLQSEQIFEQIKGNINALRGGIQFAEDLLASCNEPADGPASPDDEALVRGADQA